MHACVSTLVLRKARQPRAALSVLKRSAGGIFFPLAKALCLACGSDPEKGTAKKMGAYVMKTCFQVGANARARSGRRGTLGCLTLAMSVCSCQRAVLRKCLAQWGGHNQSAKGREGGREGHQSGHEAARAQQSETGMDRTLRQHAVCLRLPSEAARLSLSG